MSGNFYITWTNSSRSVLLQNFSATIIHVPGCLPFIWMIDSRQIRPQAQGRVEYFLVYFYSICWDEAFLDHGSGLSSTAVGIIHYWNAVLPCLVASRAVLILAVVQTLSSVSSSCPMCCSTAGMWDLGSVSWEGTAVPLPVALWRCNMRLCSLAAAHGRWGHRGTCSSFLLPLSHW